MGTKILVKKFIFFIVLLFGINVFQYVSHKKTKKDKKKIEIVSRFYSLMSKILIDKNNISVDDIDEKIRESYSIFIPNKKFPNNYQGYVVIIDSSYHLSYEINYDSLGYIRDIYPYKP